ncbi:MAG: type II secretion system F family protein [Firmicutes bacterium]|nr:type II secretion system F family protein [Bacillota bacterium]
MKFNPIKALIRAMTGKENILRENLSVVYTGDRLDRAVTEYRKKLLIRYLAVCAIFFLLTVAALFSSRMSDRSLTEIVRPGAGNADLRIPVTVEGNYKGHTVESSQELEIAAVVLSEKQIREKLSSFAETLPDQIAPLNRNGVRAVNGDLELPERDRDTGIEMRWSSSDPEVLSEEGRLDVFLLEEESEMITLSVILTLESISQESSFDVFVSDTPEAYDISLQNQIRSIVEETGDRSEGKTVVLPEESGDGIRLEWSRREESYAALVLMTGLILFFCIYAGRYDRARKKAKKYREDVIADFPSVVDKLVLLLNSGLTVFSALMRISSDYSDELQYRDSPMAAEIAAIGQKVQNTNSSVIEEWKRFATRMESSDILRFCTILEDNMSKGSELSQKLENESDELRELRKKSIQQYIRMIDSRMMIPMMAMLFSLVLVTVAPVLTGF